LRRRHHVDSICPASLSGWQNRRFLLGAKQAMSTDPGFTLPPSEQVAPGGTVSVSGTNDTDSFAASNPGSLFLSISDSAGTLNATDSTGAASVLGTNPITLGHPTPTSRTC
jgi:hypothetical protein